MVCRNSYQTHLQEVNLMQIMVNHVRVKHLKLFVQAFEWESRALTITWFGPLAHVWSGPKFWEPRFSLLVLQIGHVIKLSTSSRKYTKNRNHLSPTAEKSNVD